ncbi:hypothetical protein EXT68_23395 [Pectobacterium parmentieri]|uniref:Uncharacterized protein n=1 Tax=Pectobacterium parmentieri TaxID=1905730 RepID=A0A0H3I3U7_PECPM|nr:hypothetical protein [Pectobacterium parmentieri]AFI88500.1 Hypothetical protein W5S_0373 [Pectobacterium parmentieri]MBI0473413.1 hypothetical protein [Pectobacterium parmentieri]MBI0496050.1 hypothetical protein [Pectobacterium parmentieri]MBI0557435.1 hypothetical protein [Pectobacterium parmentieri]MBI0570573.1 hypothetical protein [Pectobacterium parmentieri]
MYLLKHSNYSGVSMFQLEMSEGEMTLYESCLHYVLTNCCERGLYEMVGCEDKEELKGFQEAILRLLVKYADHEILPKRYFDKEYPEYNDNELN